MCFDFQMSNSGSLWLLCSKEFFPNSRVNPISIQSRSCPSLMCFPLYNAWTPCVSFSLSPSHKTWSPHVSILIKLNLLTCSYLVYPKLKSNYKDELYYNAIWCKPKWQANMVHVVCKWCASGVQDAQKKQITSSGASTGRGIGHNGLGWYSWYVHSVLLLSWAIGAEQ